MSMRLIELDGRRAGPVDRGECTDIMNVKEFTQLFVFFCPDFFVGQDVAKIVKDQFISQSSGDIQFSMTALIGHQN
jgi:ubiquitin carboxyl-terminal hydrolase L3